MLFCFEGEDLILKCDSSSLNAGSNSRGAVSSAIWLALNLSRTQLRKHSRATSPCGQKCVLSHPDDFIKYRLDLNFQQGPRRQDRRWPSGRPSARIPPSWPPLLARTIPAQTKLAFLRKCFLAIERTGPQTNQKSPTGIRETKR